MSQEAVRREIAAKREYADRLEQRAQDTSKPFEDPRHADHLIAEAARLRAEADREEQHLTSRSRTFK